jgi:hypothetical protein
MWWRRHRIGRHVDKHIEQETGEVAGRLDLACEQLEAALNDVEDELRLRDRLYEEKDGG